MGTAIAGDLGLLPFSIFLGAENDEKSSSLEELHRPEPILRFLRMVNTTSAKGNIGVRHPSSRRRHLSSREGRPMLEASGQTAHLQQLVDRLQRGDVAARHELVSCAG